VEDLLYFNNESQLFDSIWLYIKQRFDSLILRNTDSTINS